jgi:hypothetical protein
MRILAIISVLVLTAGIPWAQDQQSPEPPPSEVMSGHDMSKMSVKSDAKGISTDADGSVHAMHSMEGHHLDMGPHMR